MQQLIFTGIGSRSITPQEQDVIIEISETLADVGFILRSGKADGADAAFQIGYQQYKNFTKQMIPVQAEIFIPWDGFNKENRLLEDDWDIVFGENETAWQMVKRIHKRPDQLKHGPRLLHMRNCAQVLGKDLDKPSLFVLYCADEEWITGEVSGGTRTAVELARSLGIRTFNIRRRKWIYELIDFLLSKDIRI